MTAPLVIRIPGQAVPQGSKTVYWQQRRMVDANPNLAAWRAAVTAAARQELARRNATDPIDGPVTIRLVFMLRRPASVPKARNWPSVVPDLDKLIRAVLDGLTDAKVWTNDSRVVRICAQKRYTNPYTTAYTTASITDIESSADCEPTCGQD